MGGCLGNPQLRKKCLNCGDDHQDGQKALDICRRSIQQDLVTTEGGDRGDKRETAALFTEKEDARRPRLAGGQWRKVVHSISVVCHLRCGRDAPSRWLLNVLTWSLEENTVLKMKGLSVKAEA